MNQPSINVPLLRKTMEHIEAHPEQHHQDSWDRLTAGEPLRAS